MKIVDWPAKNARCPFNTARYEHALSTRLGTSMLVHTAWYELSNTSSVTRLGTSPLRWLDLDWHINDNVIVAIKNCPFS